MRMSKEPPLCSLPIGEQGKHFLKDNRKSVKQSIKHMVLNFEEIGNAMKTEVAVLRRIIYKGNNQFRYDKFFHGLKQLNSSTSRVYEIGLPKIVFEFTDALERFDPREENQYMPCQQYGVYLLTRMIGAVMLFAKSESICMDVYNKNVQQMELGFFVPGLLFNSSVASRIWVLSKAMKKVVCDSYKDINRFVGFLTPSEAEWMCSIDDLPTNIDQYLLQGQGDVLSSDASDREKIGDGSRNVNDCDDLKTLELKTLDVGEVISRSDFKKKSTEGRKHEVTSYEEHVINSNNQAPPKKKLLGKNTTKVMNKVHEFLADQVGEPYTETPRRRSSLEVQSEKNKESIDYKELEKKIEKCKSIKMVRKKLNSLKVTVGPQYKFRGLLNTIKCINSLKSEGSDIICAKKLAIDLIRKIKKRGLLQSDSDIQKTDRNTTVGEKSIQKSVCKKDEDKKNSQNTVVNPSIVKLSSIHEVSGYFTSLLEEQGANYLSSLLITSRFTFFVGSCRVRPGPKNRIKVKRILSTLACGTDMTISNKMEKKAAKLVGKIMSAAASKSMQTSVGLDTCTVKEGEQYIMHKKKTKKIKNCPNGERKNVKKERRPKNINL